MAKKTARSKAGAGAARKRGRPPSVGEDVRRTILNLKGTDAYLEWLDALHKKTSIPKTTMFRIALAEWAMRNGHPTPPEI